MPSQRGVSELFLPVVRASEGWFFDEQGSLQSATSGAERFVYEPLTRVSEGLLVEDASTNLALQSANIDDTGAPWAGNAGFTITTSTSLIAGEVAFSHVNDGGGADRARDQAIGVFPAGAQSVSLIIENIDALVSTIGLRDTTGASWVIRATLTWATDAFVIVDGTGTIKATKLSVSGPNGGELFWLTITGTGTATNSRSLFVYPSGLGTNTLSAIVHHTQLEEFGHRTTPIVTSGVSVTRNSDEYDTANVDWARESEGTFVCEFRLSELASIVGHDESLFTLSDGSANNLIALRIEESDDTVHFELRLSGSGVFDLSGGSAGEDSLVKVAGAYKSGGSAIAVGGTLIASSASVFSFPSGIFTESRLGSRLTSVDWLFGRIAHAKYLPVRVSDSELIALTT